MKYVKLGLIGLLSVLSLMLTSCEKETATCVIIPGEMSTNMKANLYLQPLVAAAIEDQNVVMLKTMYTKSEAESEFERFIRETEKKINGLDVDNHKIPILKDTWIELELLWGSKENTIVRKMEFKATTK